MIKRILYHPSNQIGILALIGVICMLEALVYRNESWLQTLSLQESTLKNVQNYYTNGYQYENDIDNDPLYAEGFDLGRSAYTMAGVNSNHESKLNIGNYGADPFRILLPFLASFLLPLLTLHDSYLVVTTLYWILTSYAMLYLGGRIFNSKMVGVISALLCATSYQFIMLATDPKAALFQLSAVVILAALSLYLDHFSNDDSLPALANSFLLGCIGGILVFGSIGSAFFMPFLLLYGILSQRFPVFLKRNLAFGMGLLLIVAPILSFVDRGGSTISNSPLLGVLAGIDWGRWWTVYKDKMAHHFIYLIPFHFWLGAFVGLFLINCDQRKVILCMFTSLIISEFLMLNAGSPYFNWTISYYYLQVLFPIYLLNAKFIQSLISLSRRAGIAKIFTRAFLTAFIILTFFTSNLSLLGNYYYYYVSARQTPIQLLYHPYFIFNNLYVYRDLFR